MASHADPAQQQSHQVNTVTVADYPYFKDKLLTRMTVLRSSILKVLSPSNPEQDVQLAGQVHDAMDDAFIEHLSDVNAVLVSHEIAAFREIELAQQRMRHGEYGRCIDCGHEIGWRRLDAYPEAPHCLACQERFEHQATAPGRT